LVQLARAARTVTNNSHYGKINDALTDDKKQLINRSRIIQAATGKSEEFNEFIKWIQY